MAPFPLRPPAWVALACASACAAWSADPAMGGPPAPSRFGIDSATAYAHAGLEAVFYGEPASGAGDRRRAEDAYMAIHGLVQAHAYRLVGRLGLGSSYPTPRVHFDNGSAGGSTGNSQYELDLGEATLGLRLGPPDADEGIRIGTMPLQGNPDAILYGNYLARYLPFPVDEGRGLEKWDSLGSLAPKVAGVSLALGRGDGPVRAEGWLVRDEGDCSWMAFLSGLAPRGIAWGLGASGYRAFAFGDGSLSTPGKGLAEDTSRAGGFILVDSLSSSDTAFFTHSALLFSARASFDIASLLGTRTGAEAGAEAPKGRYGGVFFEAALLGWKEIPVYDPDRWRRFAWTSGTRIPTFGWLDVCVAQVEWRRPPEDAFYLSRNGTRLPPAIPIPIPISVNHPSDSGGLNPAFVNPAAPRRASPWNAGLLLAKRFGSHAEVQARFLAYAVDFSGRGASRREQALGRIVFRIR
jgi:hypothetical protein